MKRALWVTQVYPRREGDVMGAFLHRLARELPSRGWDVTVLAPGADGVVERETVDGVSVERLRYAPPGRADLAYTGEMHRAAQRHPLRFLRFLSTFRTAVSRRVRGSTRPDLVHAHWWMPSGWASLPAVRAGVPLVISAHGTDVRLTERIPPARLAAVHVLRRANRVLPVSSALATRLAKLGAAHCNVLPMPADAETFSPGIAPSEPSCFVVAARLTRQKRVDLAVRAVAALARAGTDVRLDIAGDGPERPSLETLARTQGVEERVQFHGMTDAARLADLYRAAAANVLCSEQEGYGLTVVEAALCGTPSIASRSGGLTDVVDDGVTGLLVEPGDVDALAAAMQELRDDRARRDSLGEAARHQAAAVTAGPLADRLVAIYEELTHPRV